MRTVLKVGAFIIRANDPHPRRLLLFTHPDTTVQPPGGGVDPGEEIEAALWREIDEESGLKNLALLRKVGVSKVPWNGELLERHCFLLEAPEATPEAWTHTVHGAGCDCDMPFVYQWHRIEPGFALTLDYSHFITPHDLPEVFA